MTINTGIKLISILYFIGFLAWLLFALICLYCAFDDKNIILGLLFVGCLILSYIFYIGSSEISKMTSKGWYIVMITSGISVVWSLFYLDLVTLGISGFIIYYLWSIRSDFNIKIKEKLEVK